MTVLTRPVLLPAVVVFLLVSTDRRRLPFALTRAATVLAFLLLQVWLNVTLYGTATMSGYGSASHMFDLSAPRLAANLSNFWKWSMYSGTALLWLAWPASLAVLRHERKAWELSAIGAAAAAPYLFYLVFDNWDALRFLLPTIVLALILCARALARVFSMTRSVQPWRPVATFGLALVCAFTSRQFLQREGIGQNQSMEAKYPLVGEWFRNNTSDRAVVLSSLHSGAIRMYGERQTIRWDYIPANALNQTVERLVDSGYEPYLALDLPSEPPLFEERFGSESVSAEPVARVRVVNIYKFVSAR